jgi:hypothetical protein
MARELQLVEPFKSFLACLVLSSFLLRRRGYAERGPMLRWSAQLPRCLQDVRTSSATSFRSRNRLKGTSKAQRDPVFAG